ncbi:MAG TPA: hypothetical protein VML01_07415, partial [Bryobacterales bacterium]|nr:hypothetical protein [Bryobacterales bacterium]
MRTVSVRKTGSEGESVTGARWAGKGKAQEQSAQTAHNQDVRFICWPRDAPAHVLAVNVSFAPNGLRLPAVGLRR